MSWFARLTLGPCVVLLSVTAGAVDLGGKTSQMKLAECVRLLSPGPWDLPVYALTPTLRKIYGRQLRKVVVVHFEVENDATSYLLIPSPTKALAERPRLVRDEEIVFVDMGDAETTRFTAEIIYLGHVSVDLLTERVPAPHPVTTENTTLGSILKIGARYYAVISKRFVESDAHSPRAYFPQFGLVEFDSVPRKGQHNRGTKTLTLEWFGEYKLDQKSVRGVRKLGDGVLNVNVMILNGRELISAIFLEWTSEVHETPHETYTLRLRDFRKNKLWSSP